MLFTGQFVYPKPEYNLHEPGIYHEDPFIVEYRKKFFSVFRGDFKTFNQAREEIDAMLAKNPKDARALVWKGNGQTIEASLLRMKGKLDEAKALATESRGTLDSAVALRPRDPNIYMMRVATLYVQGQFLPVEWMPKRGWEEIRDDCTRFLKFFGPAKIPKLSIHVRGEAIAEKGISEEHLGEIAAAKKDFAWLAELNRGTDYASKAQKEIEKLDSVDSKSNEPSHSRQRS